MFDLPRAKPVRHFARIFHVIFHCPNAGFCGLINQSTSGVAVVLPERSILFLRWVARQPGHGGSILGVFGRRCGPANKSFMVNATAKLSTRTAASTTATASVCADHYCLLARSTDDCQTERLAYCCILILFLNP